MVAAPRPAEGIERIAGYGRLEPAGKGRLAVVYRAVEERQQRTVALKVILLDGLNRAVVRQFARSCRLTARLSGHPNVVTARDVGTTRSGRPFVAMDYFERGSLGDRLARGGPLPLEEALCAGVEIAAALGAAHAAGIVHRDVRPRNVLVSEAGQHALADFDVAALAAAADGGLRVLSPFHTAPEVLDGRPPSVASDVYSLGATLYELLAGRPPFEAVEAEGALARRIVTEPLPPIPRQDVPPAVEALIGEAMRGPAPERIADAFTFADRLRQIQEELGLTVTELPAEWRKRPSPPEAGDGPPPDAEPPDADDTRRRTQRVPIGPVMSAAERDRGTRTRKRRPPQPGTAPSRRSPRGDPMPTIAGFLLLLLAGLTVELGFHFALQAFRSAPSQQTTPAPRQTQVSPAPASTEVPAAVIASARPTGLTVTDNGASAVLHWQLQPGNRYPLFVRRVAAGGGAPTDLPVPDGSTTTTITGLDPHGHYCFQVGAVVAFGQPSTVAWSPSLCIPSATAGPATGQS